MSNLKSAVVSLVKTGEPSHVWVPTDFSAFGSRDAVDKTLQRLVHDGELRRIDRGLYDRPTINRLTQRPTSPDYRAVIDAIARRDQLRMLVDGMTAANDLGFTDAVPARVTVHTDARRRAVKLDNLIIEFKQTAPSRLYWAGRPAMRVVQALYWLKDTLVTDRPRILSKLSALLADPIHGDVVRKDLLEGFSTLPTWMQNLVRELPGCNPTASANAKRPRPKSVIGEAA
ncbi:MAG: DUF6088 family protein [Hydrogenophaga sp.]|uniref:DUF6088 family protein n=1 Tax=Hydrogenophaga sp. TaxID=1904254 RepID=UPI002725AE0C|nr:DUF6088 family protein [Hydrogenophaga sp.]MDO9202485.1 DUF6088 family protein [Hydrogenophaga sp.]MDO9482317.1 DUF6088 family protein [Hydrogenophaga sp.]MDP1895159.1 DUF6088 family protein [Hydrogenophaga sp.]MDP3347647.1 DUF6088 family protein [Hydrogenophaga sp.]MDP3806159.1 DUF6088 family protein [Hydrogenophaga sp.]